MVSRVQQALQFFTGLGLTPAQAAGLVGNLQQESGMGLNPLALGDNGASFGVAQHQGPRRRALNAFAAERGTDPSDFPTQLAFIAHEGQTTERDAWQRLTSAQTPEEAATAAVSFFRPGDPRTGNRIRNALALVGDPVSGDARFGNPLPPRGTTMATGPRGLLDSLAPSTGEPVGLLNSLFSPDNFLLNLGMGILANNTPGASVASALGGGLQFATGRGQQALENQIVREQLSAASRKRSAVAELRELFQSDPDITGSDSRVRSLLFELDPASAIETLSGPKPSSLEQKITTIEQRLGRPLTEEELLKLSGGGTTINVGDAKSDEPLSISDLNRLRLPDGSTPPIGTTAREARALGARVVSADEAKQMNNTERALAVLDEIEGLALGNKEEPGIFVGIDPGVLSRGVAAADFIIGDLIQQDPKVAGFRGLSSGTLGSLIRSLGEAGTLSDADQKRALDLLPKTFPFADSEETARAKLKTLRRILSQGAERLRNLQGEDAPVEEDDKPSADGAPDFRFNPSTGELEAAR